MHSCSSIGSTNGHMFVDWQLTNHSIFYFLHAFPLYWPSGWVLSRHEVHICTYWHNVPDWPSVFGIRLSKNKKYNCGIVRGGTWHDITRTNVILSYIYVCLEIQSQSVWLIDKELKIGRRLNEVLKDLNLTSSFFDQSNLPLKLRS